MDLPESSGFPPPPPVTEHHPNFELGLDAGDILVRVDRDVDAIAMLVAAPGTDYAAEVLLSDTSAHQLAMALLACIRQLYARAES